MTLNPNYFLCSLVLVALSTGCMADAEFAGEFPADDAIAITSADLVSLPDGDMLVVDLDVDAVYTIDLNKSEDRSRVLLEYQDYSIALDEWYAGFDAFGDDAAMLADGCPEGWTLECNGNVCCTVCQSTGLIGACKGVQN